MAKVSVVKTNQMIIEAVNSTVVKTQELLISSIMDKTDIDNSLVNMISQTNKCTMATAEVDSSTTRTASMATNGKVKRNRGTISSGIINSMSPTSSIMNILKLLLTSAMFSQPQPSYPSISKNLSLPLKVSMTQL